jgi:hypothetical protein
MNPQARNLGLRTAPRTSFALQRAILVLAVLAAVLMTVSPIYADSSVNKSTIFYDSVNTMCVWGYSALTLHASTGGADRATIAAYTLLVTYTSCAGNSPWPYKTEPAGQTALREDLNYWNGSYFWPCQSVGMIYSRSPLYYQSLDATYFAKPCGAGFYQTNSYVYAYDPTLPYGGWVGGSLTSGYLYQQ